MRNLREGGVSYLEKQEGRNYCYGNHYKPQIPTSHTVTGVETSPDPSLKKVSSYVYTAGKPHGPPEVIKIPLFPVSVFLSFDKFKIHSEITLR
jgi:hypothetical protein